MSLAIGAFDPLTLPPRFHAVHGEGMTREKLERIIVYRRKRTDFLLARLTELEPDPKKWMSKPYAKGDEIGSLVRMFYQNHRALRGTWEDYKFLRRRERER